MALTGTTGRLVADTTIGVEDLKVPLDNFLKSCGHRDLWRALDPPRGLSFKKAPMPEWLAHVAPLFAELVEVARNGMLPPKKLRTCLQKMIAEEGINYTKKADSDYVDMVDEALRVAFSQYRTLKSQSSAKDRACKQMTARQMQAVDKVLEKLVLSADQKEDSQEDSAAEVSPVPKAMLALTDGSPECTEGNEGKSTPKATLNRSFQMAESMAIFERVLSRVSSEETEPQGHETPSSSRLVNEGGLHSGPSPFTSMLMGRMSDADTKLLGEAYDVEPLGEDGKCQLKIFRENVGSKSSGKGKGKSKGKGKGKGKVIKNESKKKTSKSPKAAAKSAAKAKAKRPEIDEAGPVKKQQAPKKNKKPPPTAKKPKSNKRAAVRKRFLSKAYHNERDLHLRAGMSYEDACLKGQAASQKAAEKFDKENPRAQLATHHKKEDVGDDPVARADAGQASEE